MIYLWAEINQLGHTFLINLSWIYTMNRNFASFIFFALIGFNSASIVVAEDGPESVMRAYSDFTKKGMAEKAYHLLSKDDRDLKSLDQFKKIFKLLI